MLNGCKDRCVSTAMSKAGAANSSRTVEMYSAMRRPRLSPVSIIIMLPQRFIGNAQVFELVGRSKVTQDKYRQQA